MKKFVLVPVICIVTFAICIGVDRVCSVANTSSKPVYPTIVIDAGHGGVDAGAIAIDSTQEKTINLDIALSLYDHLMTSGINAVLIRSGDYEIYPDGIDRSRSDLYNRMDFVNSVSNAVLISIHQNHYDNEAEWGTQIWYSPNDAQSKAFADSILNNIKQYIQPENKRQNKASDNSYYLLYKAQVPSIMVECGFISNREENKKLKNNHYQNQLAYAMLLGINGEL